MGKSKMPKPDAANTLSLTNYQAVPRRRPETDPHSSCPFPTSKRSRPPLLGLPPPRVLHLPIQKQRAKRRRRKRKGVGSRAEKKIRPNRKCPFALEGRRQSHNCNAFFAFSK